MEVKNWSMHLEFVVIFMTLVGGFYMIDGKIERYNLTQTQRTDRLYEMFIHLLKERK